MTNYGFIVPVFNHPHHLDQLVATLDQFDLQIILINDGSDAHCTQKMRELDQKYIKVHLLEHPYNQGKGQAVVVIAHGVRKLETGFAAEQDGVIDLEFGQEAGDILRFVEGDAVEGV